MIKKCLIVVPTANSDKKTCSLHEKCRNGLYTKGMNLSLNKAALFSTVMRPGIDCRGNSGSDILAQIVYDP